MSAVSGEKKSPSPPGGAAPPVTLELVSCDQTRELRRAVLRPHQSLEELACSDELELGSGSGLHFAAREKATGQILSCATVLPEKPSGHALGLAQAREEQCFRLRGVATAQQWRSIGLGGLVMGAVLTHIEHCGGGILWCNARIGAQAFYERHRFSTYGSYFPEPDLPLHVVMWRAVPDAS